MLKEASLDKCRYPLCILQKNGWNFECYHNNKVFYAIAKKNGRIKRESREIAHVIETMESNFMPDIKTTNEVDSAIMTFVYPML